VYELVCQMARVMEMNTKRIDFRIFLRCITYNMGMVNVSSYEYSIPLTLFFFLFLKLLSSFSYCL